MKYKKTIYTATLIIVVGGVCALLWWRKDKGLASSEPPQVMANGNDLAANGTAVDLVGSKPADSSEWARVRAETRGNKDLDSIVRAFKLATDCLAFHDAVDEVNSLLKDESLGDLSTETLATLQRMDASSSRNVSLVQRLDGLCKGSDKNQLVHAFSDAVFEAAMKGNAEAQTCFLLMGPSPWQGSRSIPAEESEVGRYTTYAPGFTQKALERADPRIGVKVLASYVESSQGHASLNDRSPQPDPALTWRAARLASLRALPEQRSIIAYRLAAFRDAGGLSSLAVKQADDWAKEVFDREYAGQSPIDVDSPVECYSSPDLAP